MVEVDPMILLTAGSIAVSMATVAFCLRAPSKAVINQHISADRAADQLPVLKPKKKQTRTAKKSNVPSSTITPVQSEESEIAAIMADLGPIDLTKKTGKKVKDSSSNRAFELAAVAAKKVAELEEAAREAEVEKEEAEAEIAASLADALLAEEEEKRSKKPKESAEQKAARVERQKIAKMKKAEEEELSKKVAIQLAATDREIAASLKNKDSTTPAQADGWAVVEDKRKVKSKPLSVSATTTAEESVQGIPAVSADFVKNDISIDSKKIGIIIGPKGVTLHGIQNICGVEINTPKGDRDTVAPMIVSISGPAEGVRKATQAIHELCTKGYSKMLAPEDFKEGSIEVHPSYLSEIIGKSGANIRAIQDFTGVKLAIPQVARDHSQLVKINVAGNKEKVQQAKDLIVELTKYYHTSVTHPGQIHVEMDVPSALYNYIIGARGSEIKHIQANFKVSVHIPNVDTISKNVLVVGDPHGVKGAEKYIQKIIDQAIADKEHAEKMADSWVDGEGETEEAGHEQWMDAYVHPSRAIQSTSDNKNGTVTGSSVFDDYNGGLQSSGGSASSASAAASASAWGSSVLTSSEGW